MAEKPSTPQWEDSQPSNAVRSAAQPLADKISREPFWWPTPPFAFYPAPSEQTDPMPCEIVGRNDKHMLGRLTFFVPDQSVAYVQLPPARTTLLLRFDRFRSLTLTTPLTPRTPSQGDPHADLSNQRTASPFSVTLAGGGEMKGTTIGHVESEVGLFLFPPHGDEGAVLRTFVPRIAFTDFHVGPRIGELLVDEHQVTKQQINKAVDMQQTMRSQKLGDILVTRKIVSPKQLLDAIDRQDKMPLVRIGQALLSLGMIEDDQLNEALAQQRLDRSVPLGEVLVRMGVVSREDLQTALARKMGYPLVDLDAFPFEAEALRKLSYSVASRLRVMPLLVRDGRLVVAMDDPARREAIDEIEFNADMKVVPVLARGRSIESLLTKAYEKIGGSGPRTGRATSRDAATSESGGLDSSFETAERGTDRGSDDDDEAIEPFDRSIEQIINNMVIEAHRESVSDIHIESDFGRDKLRVRFRKDGLLRTYLELPSSHHNAVITRIKIMCDLDISERRKPQDGKLTFSKFSAQHKIELRVATIPTNNGLEDVVFRLLAAAEPIPVDSLGLSDRNLKALLHAVERPHGMVLCVGPSGSGKTTTVHSALSHINVPERKIWTAEDPIEITQPGLRQVQVNPRIGWTFDGALRAFLRADPDVIMLGEIRDKESAQMAIEASLTGHLVLSTLHTNSAPETVSRLLDMGMNPFNFSDSLLAVLGQRLVRRCCLACRTPYRPRQDEVDELLGDYMNAFGEGEPPVTSESVLASWTQRHSRDGRLVLHKSPGCDRCDDTGFKGRAGIHEMMVISADLRRLIQGGARAEALQQKAMAEGMRTLRQDGIDKVLAGTTTIEEVRAATNV